jgi:hypothetical protein
MNDKPKKPGVSLGRGRLLSKRGYRHWNNVWSHDCPEGTWTGRLEKKGWAESPEMALYFTDTATQERYWLLVSSSGNSRPRDSWRDFMKEAEPGDVFELTTTKTKAGNPSLTSARKIRTLARGDET